MARFTRGGFVRVSTEISSQKVYNYNYSDIGIFLELHVECWVRNNKIDFFRKGGLKKRKYRQ